LSRNFPWYLRAWEGLQRLATASDWPARLVSRFGAGAVQVTREEITLAKSLGESSTLRVGFAADLHAGAITPPSLIEAACSALRDAEPDLILLGGDFVSLRTRDVEHLRGPLAELSAPFGVFAVLGNHDHWVGTGPVRSVLERSGIRLLENRSHRLDPPFGNTLIVGLDDHMAGWPDSSKAAWDPGAVTILLLHQPSGILDAADRPFDLALAGHTHAGQIVLPGGLALVLPHGALSRTYRVGRHTLAPGQELFVTRGVGNSGLPFRLGAPSEVVICTVYTGAPRRDRRSAT
jgi:hypothetical protein